MKQLRKKAELSTQFRIEILNLIYKAKSGHTGGDLSVIDLLTALYFDIMNLDPERPHDENRDRLILSKGHCVEAYYVVLANRGFFPKEELDTYGQWGTRLFGHPTTKVPGVEFATGALGHGLSIAVGTALGAKRLGYSYRTFVILGDGELAEGSVWEAAMAASHYRLDNLVAIIDYNKLQISGQVDSVMKTSPLTERWAAFGWKVVEIDGHSPEELITAVKGASIGQGLPLLILAHTIKGKGVSFMENQVSWHHRVPTSDELARALEELGHQQRALVG